MAGSPRGACRAPELSLACCPRLPETDRALRRGDRNILIKRAELFHSGHSPIGTDQGDSETDEDRAFERGSPAQESQSVDVSAFDDFRRQTIVHIRKRSENRYEDGPALFAFAQEPDHQKR